MQQWLSAWYDESYTPQVTRQDEMMMEELAALEGAEFEQMFMQEMIDHHRLAIDRSNECLFKAYHGELINLCRDIVVAQAKEIAQMRLWLCQWYNLCVLERQCSIVGHG